MAPAHRGSIEPGHPNSNTELRTRVSLQTQNAIRRKVTLVGGVLTVLNNFQFCERLVYYLFTYLITYLHLDLH